MNSSAEPVVPEPVVPEPEESDEEFDEGFFIEYEDRDDDDTVYYDTLDEAKVEYDLIISRGERKVEIWKVYGYNNDDRICVWGREQQQQPQE